MCASIKLFLATCNNCCFCLLTRFYAFFLGMRSPVKHFLHYLCTQKKDTREIWKIYHKTR